ncbi:hypothetical protein VSR82_14790 [Burkholderia sp. JPY481]
MAIAGREGKSTAADARVNRCAARHAVLVVGAEATPVVSSLLCPRHALFESGARLLQIACNVGKREKGFTLITKEAAPASGHHPSTVEWIAETTGIFPCISARVPEAMLGTLRHAARSGARYARDTGELSAVMATEESFDGVT